MTRSNRLAAAILSSLLIPGALLAVTPAGPEIAVRATTAGAVIGPRVGVFPDGGFVVAWTTAGPNSVVRARLFDATGAAAGGEFRLMPPGGQTLDDLKVTADGGFVVAWDQPRTANPHLTSVQARRFDRRGIARSAPFVVHEPNALGVGGARLAATVDGGFAVAWIADHADEGHPGQPRRDALVRTFDANNLAKGPAILVAMGDDFDSSYIQPSDLAAAPDGTLVLASDCLCNQGGTTLHRIVPRVGVQSIDLSETDGGDFKFSASVAMAADGSFLVAWQTGSESAQNGIPSVIQARRFAANGTARGAIFQVNRRGGLEGAVRAAALSNGEVAIVWHDAGGRDGAGFGIYSRGYAADGTTAGPDLLVNRATAGDQYLPALAAAGQAVAVWLGPGPIGQNLDPIGAQVEARRLRPY